MAHLVIASAGSVVVLVIALFARVETYRVAPVFLIPLIWLPLLPALRRQLDLHPLHYALLVSAILLHDLGAFGFYQRWRLPFSFDIAVHFYFAFAASFSLHRALAKNFPLRAWQATIATLFLIMGCGALHEIMEYGTYLLLGEQKGMLKPTTSYVFDTQRDLLSNLAGATIALALIEAHRLVVRTRILSFRPYSQGIHAHPSMRDPSRVRSG
jgi:uncharacterized membrane protein YjdF